MRTRISDVCICLRTASFCALAVLLVASASWLVKSVGRERNRRQTTMNFQVILTSISAYSHDFKHLPFPVQRVRPSRRNRRRCIFATARARSFIAGVLRSSRIWKAGMAPGTGSNGGMLRQTKFFGRCLDIMHMRDALFRVGYLAPRKPSPRRTPLRLSVMELPSAMAGNNRCP